MVTHAAPGLQHILNQALQAGGWFGAAHEAELARAAASDPADERLQAVRTLVAEETRLGMLVGVAVGLRAGTRTSERSPRRRRGEDDPVARRP